MDNRNKIILAVDDESSVLELLRHLLVPDGYTVLSTDRARSAIQIASDVRIDLLLADVFMPSLGAKALANRISMLQPGLKVIFMTVYSRESMIDHGVVPRGAVILQKPVSKNDLLARVRDSLASGAGWRQSARGGVPDEAALTESGNAVGGNLEVTG